MNKFKIIFVFFLAFVLTGCWDRVELEEQAYVIVIGIDQGKGNLLSVTYQIANTESNISAIIPIEK